MPWKCQEVETAAPANGLQSALEATGNEVVKAWALALSLTCTLAELGAEPERRIPQRQPLDSRIL